MQKLQEWRRERLVRKPRGMRFMTPPCLVAAVSLGLLIALMDDSNSTGGFLITKHERHWRAEEHASAEIAVLRRRVHARASKYRV